MRRILLVFGFVAMWLTPSPSQAQAICISSFFPRPCAIFTSYETYIVDGGGDFIGVNFEATGEWTRWDPRWHYFEMHFDIFFEHGVVSTGYGGFDREISLWNNPRFERATLEPYGELQPKDLIGSLSVVQIFDSEGALISDGFVVIPEPSTVLLLGTGLLGLAGVGLKKRRGTAFDRRPRSPRR